MTENKHIEVCKPETIGAAILDERATDYQPIQSAARQLGFAVEPPQEPRTDIHELPAVLRAFARKAADALLAPILRIVRESYALLEPRLKAYKPAAFPDETVRDLAHLPQAIAAMGERKINPGNMLISETDGQPEIPDGISLAYLLCSSDAANRVTEIVDTNRGWVMDRQAPNFPNLRDATLRMRSITGANALNNFGARGKVEFPELKNISSGSSQYNDPMPLNATEIIADEVETSDAIFSQKAYPNLRKVSMKKVRSFNGRCFYDLQAEGPLTTVIVPELRSYDTWSFLLDYSGVKDKYLSLIHLEIGSDVNCYIANWSPTYILTDNPSGNDLVEDEGIQTNLQQFLVNLRKYICLRLADRAGTTALTLTLSQAVRNAANDSTRTLASLGITTADLTDKERAAGITTATTYAAWFNAYMGAINWNVSPTATN